MMKMIIKIEDLINRGLFWLMSACSKIFHRYCPEKVKALSLKTHAFLKSVPIKFKNHFLKLKAAPQELKKINYAGVIASALDAGIKAFKASKEKSILKALLAAFMAPLLFIFEWASSLKPQHFFILSTFTAASIASVFAISLSVSHIINHVEFGRAPASIDPEYSRPDYYKKNLRTTSFNTLKIPAVIQESNALRALHVDISFTSSNRETKMWIEKNEFQIRDHLILTIEPVIPSFALTIEGQSMVKDKIRDELNRYLETNQIEGVVEETHILSILSH